MQIDTGEFAAIKAVAEVTADQIRAVHGRGYEAGHRAARRNLWPLIMLLLAHLAAQLIRNNGLLQAAKVMYDQGREDEKDARQPWAASARPRHLRLVTGGRHAR